MKPADLLEYSLNFHILPLPKMDHLFYESAEREEPVTVRELFLAIKRVETAAKAVLDPDTYTKVLVPTLLRLATAVRAESARVLRQTQAAPSPQPGLPTIGVTAKLWKMRDAPDIPHSAIQPMITTARTELSAAFGRQILGALSQITQQIADGTIFRHQGPAN